MRRFFRFAVLLLWSFAAVLLFHSRAVAPYLRHTRVAEGNISRAVHRIWHGGFTHYAEALALEARQWGRVRPVHVLFHGIPFVITLVRNGDLWHRDAEVMMPDRINGCLQTHTWYLICVYSVMLASLGTLIGRVTGRAWLGALFALLAAVGGKSLSENLLVNYCDSGEIGQLLFISLYLLSLAGPLAGSAPTRRAEGLGLIALILAYGMKETSIALLPAVLAGLGFRLLPALHPAPALRRFVLRHALVHGALAGVLLTLAWRFRCGAYVSQHYNVHGGAGCACRASWNLLALPFQTICVMAAGLLLSVLTLAAKRSPAGRPARAVDTLSLLAVCGISAAGFWALALPWSAPLPKYYLPVFVFATASAVALIALAGEGLGALGGRGSARVWVIGAALFMVQSVPSDRLNIRRFYRRHYECRKTVPAVSQDIASLASNSTSVLCVRLVPGTMFQEGALPFWRTVNRAHRLNIAKKGEVTSWIRSPERNYFRRYPSAPAVEIRWSVELPETLSEDVVYLFDRIIDDGHETMAAQGYELSKEWTVGHPGTRVARYVPAARREGQKP